MNNVVPLFSADPAVIKTRSFLVSSWNAAVRNIDPVHNTITLNHASAAGWLLDQHRIAAIAWALCPPEPWFDTVREYLGTVIDEERASE